MKFESTAEVVDRQGSCRIVDQVGSRRDQDFSLLIVGESSPKGLGGFNRMSAVRCRTQANNRNNRRCFEHLSKCNQEEQKVRHRCAPTFRTVSDYRLKSLCWQKLRF